MMGIAAAVCSLVSCRKDLDEVLPKPTVTVSRPAQLAANPWRQTGLLVSTARENKVASADLFAHVNPSMLDQLASFQTDGTYTVLKGGAGAQPKVGHWALNAASDSITLTLPDQVRRLAVTELAPDAMSLSFTDVATNGSTSTYTSVYSH